jgi:farnesyl-diphosphate farnesyltransferase
VEDTLKYTRYWLSKVSRSFAPSIAILDEPMEASVGIAYLLCRVVDTVEDEPAISEATRKQLFETFIASLKSLDNCPKFASSANAIFKDIDGQDARLMCDTERLWSFFHRLPDSQRAAMVPRITEMAEGMGNFAQVINDEDELSRYCHVVAGVVGELLTDLYIQSEGAVDTPTLRENSESFGQALQLVNIAKDMAEDASRGRQFLPRTYCPDVPTSKLLLPKFHTQVIAAHTRLCDLANSHLQAAFHYTLAIPKDSPYRRFCALPLLLAKGTLSALKGNPEALNPAVKIKISKDAAVSVFQSCLAGVLDDKTLKLEWSRL